MENNTLHLLRVDNSGFGTEIDKQDISDWDREDEFTRVTVWKDKYYTPIAGKMDQTYPQNEGWVSGTDEEISSLSDFTISNTTKN